MPRRNLAKICTIIGFILAEIYMVFAVLAPYRPGKPARMIIPESMIPKIEGVAPGTPPPPGALAVKLAVCAVFFGPFGACVGLGVGLLVQGGLDKLATSRRSSQAKP
jgi:hypothetical protein